MQSRLLTFTNSRGESITFRNNSSFFINNIVGLGDVDAEIQMQKSPYQDGASYIDSVLEPRAISFQVNILGENDTDISQKRSNLAALFNPKLGPGRFEYRYGDIVRIIDAIPEHVPNFPTGFQNRGRRHQVAIVDLICPNPYWRSTTIVEEPMAAFVELFEFPSDYWEVGEDGDLYFEVGFEGEKREFIIEGDAAVPIEITFHGPLLNPTLRNNTTGQMFKINRRLETGDKLVVDTDGKTVLLNGEDVFPWIDIDSEFWSLQVGPNEIQYFADEGIESARLELRWQERYVAV